MLVCKIFCIAFEAGNFTMIAIESGHGVSRARSY